MTSKKSLKHGINLIFLSVWFIIFVIQIIYIYALYQQSLRDTRATFSNSMTSVHSILEQNVHTCRQISNSMLTDHTIMEYFQCNDKTERQNLWNSITAPLQNIYNITSEQFYIISFNTEKELMDFSNYADSQVLQLSHHAQAAFRINNERFNLYVVPNTPFTDIYIFFVYDIKTPDTNNVGMNFIGTVAVAGKINKEDLVRQTGIEENVNLTLRYNGDKENDIVLLSGLSGDKQLFWERSIETTNWSICGSANADTPLSTGLILLIAETIFMSVLFWIIQQFIKRYIFSPINKISDFLENYSLTKKNERINLQNQTEIGNVADKIDEMIDNIEHLSRHIVQTQQKLYESEIAQKDASLYALQAQLNPHFMYNTLDCICGIANASQMPQIADVAVALAKMLRYSLSEGQSVPLLQEIEIVKNYLTIMEVRRPNFFTAEFNISQNAEKLLCPKMLLQPIIENTFKHGFDFHMKDAKVIISAELESDCLLITIFDNGCGLSEDKQTAIRNSLDMLNHSFCIPSNDSVHIGLINIQNRIRLNYGDDFGLRIESEEGKFTKIILKLPKMYYDEKTDD